jgi:uncharacterized protein
MNAIAWTLPLGLVAGIFGGMFGIGGGLVIVPGLILLFGYNVKSASGTSLFAQLLPVGLLAVYEYWKSDHVNVKAGVFVAIGLFAGTFIGSRIALSISDVAMKRAYAVFLIGVAIYFLTKKG